MENPTAEKSASKSGKPAYLRLKPIHRAFVDAYLQFKVGVKAMEAIGYTGKRPDQASWRFKRRPDVQEALVERGAEILHGQGINLHDVLSELGTLAFAELPTPMKLGALVKILDYLKPPSQKHEVTGKDGLPLAPTTVYVVSREEAAKVGAELDDSV